MRNGILVALLEVFVCAGLARAQGSPAEPTLLTTANAQAPNTGSDLNTTTNAQTLTRQEAEQFALKNNPQVSVAALLALAQKQVVRETRSAELPALNGNLSGVDAEEASRLGSGSLDSSRLLYHAGAGLTLDQLITDFGRTRNLVDSSSLQAKASEQNEQATREEMVLATDMAFYGALEAQATLDVAKRTVEARQAVNDQVDALTASNLKSTLDQRFAQANLSQSRLLLLDSQNQFDTAIANLNEVLGTTDNNSYRLVDDPAIPPPVASSLEGVITLALKQRPDLLAANLNHDAAVSFSKAQHEQLLPTISGLGVAGVTPVGSSIFFTQKWYGAAGVNVAVPVFNGFKFHADASEADLRAKMSNEQSRVILDRIVRDVRAAWLAANTAQQRMAVTAQFLLETDSALDLADTRYNLGLSSIVELSQAQLQQTQAQIAESNARFEYEADLAALRFQSGIQP